MRISRPVPADSPAATRADSPAATRADSPAATSADGPAAAMRAGRPDGTQRLLRATAAVLLIGGLVTVGATGLNWWSRIHRIEASQVKLARAVDAEWPRTPERRQAGRAGGAASVPVVRGTAGQDPGDPGAAPSPSDPLARLHIPRLGLDLVVVEGSGDADLLRGPGHISNTPLFGHPGNVGVAGHRYPGVFWDLDRLRDGDPVVVETSDHWYVYRVSREMIVGPSDVDVLAPHPAGAPTGARDFLTLVTCDPVFTTLHRLIRQAVLVRATPRADGAPLELAVN